MANNVKYLSNGGVSALLATDLDWNNVHYDIEADVVLDIDPPDPSCGVNDATITSTTLTGVRIVVQAPHQDDVLLTTPADILNLDLKVLHIIHQAIQYRINVAWQDGEFVLPEREDPYEG